MQINSKKTGRTLLISFIFLSNMAAFQNCSKLSSESASIAQDPNRGGTTVPGPEVPGAVDPVTGFLKPINDPNRHLLSGVYPDEYELKLVESEEDDHLKLSFTKRNNQFYLSDLSTTTLQSVTYTLNGWTDMQGANQLIDEPILPYRLYHIAKWSADVSTLDDWWKTMYGDNRASAKRSELFFYLVKKGDPWNPVGQSNNPIGRPYVFFNLPAFSLKNRSLQFEYNFVEETAERKKELSILTAKENKLLMIYSTPLEQFIQSRGINRGLHDFTQEECIAYADTLPTGGILAFDVEPPEGKHWIIDYSGPNYDRNLEYVIKRLAEKGTIAYDWMHSKPIQISLDGKGLQQHKSFGPQNTLIAKYKEAYSKIDQIKKNHNYYPILNLGHGYDPYDNNLSPLDEGKENFSPQLSYLQNLNAQELWHRVFPTKPIFNFIWGYVEYDFMLFTPNQVVNVPEYNAKAKRLDNKPLYPPSFWEDNTMLSFINSKYTFYWSPNSVSWNPASVSYYNSAYTNGGFSVWSYIQGSTPPSDKAYLGKEAMAVNSTIQAAYNFSRIQEAADGAKYAAAFKYKRANKDGSSSNFIDVSRIDDGSWYMDALIKKQPFCIILTNNGKTVVLFQDVWSRPGRGTEFEFTVNGKTHKAITEGNRLFAAVL